MLLHDPNLAEFLVPTVLLQLSSLWAHTLFASGGWWCFRHAHF